MEKIVLMMEGFKVRENALNKSQNEDLVALARKHKEERNNLISILKSIQADCTHPERKDLGDLNYHKNVWEEEWTCTVCGKGRLKEK